MMSEDPKGTVHSFEIEGGANEDAGSMDNVRINDDAGNTLPSVEEARQTIPHKRVAPPAKKNRVFCFAFMGLIIVALVVAIVVLALDLKDANNRAAIQSHKETLMSFLLEKEISTGASLRLPYSPQSQALSYLAEEQASNGMSYLYDEMALNEQKIIERYALAVLFFALNDNGDWNPDYSFLTPKDYCSWKKRVYTINNRGQVVYRDTGVSLCNGEGHVTELILGRTTSDCLESLLVFFLLLYLLAHASIVREVPYEIRHLTQLQSLQLTANDISGDFPSGILNLPNLKILALGNNKFKGTIPIGLGDLTQLSALVLSNNSFEGNVPTSLAQLSALTNLQLFGNSLSGNLNQLLTNLDYLKYLDVQGNSLTGSLDWLNRMNLLEHLDVSDNQITGQIPGSLVNHPTLILADIHGNSLTGTLPVPTGTNAVLQLLIMNGNKVGGTVPGEIASLFKLAVLDISFNEFTGQLPDMNLLRQLQFLVTSENSFSPQPMPDLHGFTELKYLTMKGNKISGTIPDWIGGLTALTWLDLDANLLTGTIPSQIGKISKLDTLLLNRNDLNGTLPAEMAGLLELKNVLIDGNDLTGDTTVLCDKIEKFEYFISDCKSTDEEPEQISCRCCTKCCATGDVGCSDFEWSVELGLSGKYLTRDSDFNMTDAGADFSKLYDDNP
eukprot:scaffold9520_cov105-Cylindrotheca_fusiformis.AAC.1